MRRRVLAAGMGLAMMALAVVAMPAQALGTQTVCKLPAGCLPGSSVLDHGCLIVGIAGWPPQPRFDPDCIGTSPSSPPNSDNSTASPSSSSNSTGEP